MTKIEIEIEGMQCGMCESHVNDTIRKAFPVKKVTSSHTKNQTIVLAEEEITDDQIREALAPTGYEILGIHREPYEKKGLLRSRK